LRPRCIHGGDRDAVDPASPQTGELNADRLVEWRHRGRARDLQESVAGARRVGRAVVKTIESKLRQWTSIGVRGRRVPNAVRTPAWLDAATKRTLNANPIACNQWTRCERNPSAFGLPMC